MIFGQFILLFWTVPGDLPDVENAIARAGSAPPRRQYILKFEELAVRMVPDGYSVASVCPWQGLTNPNLLYNLKRQLVERGSATAVVLLTPPIVRLLRRANLLSALRHRLTLRQLDLGFPVLRDDLLWSKSLPRHLAV
jgi:transposase-like protein